MKKLLAILLVLCMLISSVVVVSAEDVADFTKTVKKKAEFTFTAGQAVTPGAIMFTPNFKDGDNVNIKNYKYVDVAIYAYNPEALANVTMAYEMTSSGQPDVEENCYTFKFSEMALANGWNVVRFPMGKWLTGPANVEKINFFRFFSAEMAEVPTDTFVKIYSTTLTNNETITATPEVEVTLPEFVPPEVKESVHVNTTAEIEFLKEFTIPAGGITPGVQFNINAEFDPLDITDVEYVELHVNLSNAAQFAAIEFQFELTSGGTCDAYENNFTGCFEGLKDGENVIKVPIDKFTGVSGGGFDKTKINFLRMYSQAGNVGTEFTVTVDKVVFVNPKNLPTPNYESGATGNEFGVTNIVVISNCEDGTGFENGEATTEIVNRGTGAQKWTYAAGEVPFPSAMFTYLAPEPIDATGMTRFAFDLYVSDAAALKDVDFHMELTSGGTCDAEEFQSTNTFAALTASKELVNGWNTCYIGIEGAGGCDFTRWNYFRFFQAKAFNTPSDLVMCIDNIRFETYVLEPAGSEGVEVQQFKVFNEATEGQFLVRTNAGNNGTQRFSDANAETVYKFTVKNRYNVSKVTFTATTNAQLLFQVSQDDANWQDVFVFEYDPNGQPSQGLPKKEREFDLTSFVDLEANNVIYVRIADAEPSNGWGGGIFPDTPATLTVEYTPLSKDELDAKEAYSDENSIALIGFNKPHGSMTVDNSDYTAGSGSNIFTLGSASGATFDPVDGTGMDTLTFDLYISDLALFDVKFGNTGLELTSSGACDNSEISWNLAGIKEHNIGGELVAGWNHVILPLETATPDDRGGKGDFDISAINFFRLFMVSPEGGEGIVVKIDNMRLDNSGIARKEAQLKADQEVANKVIKLIDDIGEVTLDSERDIEKADNAFKKLTADQKALVTNKDVLDAAKDQLKALQDAQTENPPVDGGEDQPPVDGGEDQPPVDGGEDQPPVDDGIEPPADESNNTVVIIIVVVAVVVVAAAVCVYFFVFKKKK